MEIFFTLFYQPIFNLLIFLYNVVPFHDLGLAIILLTLIIRLLLYPLSVKAIKSQKDLQTIQPEIEKIKEKDPEMVDNINKLKHQILYNNKDNEI